MYKCDIKFTKHTFQWVFHRLISTVDGTRRQDYITWLFQISFRLQNAYECQIASLPTPCQWLLAPASRAEQHYHLVVQPSLEVASHENLTDQMLLLLMVPRRHWSHHIQTVTLVQNPVALICQSDTKPKGGTSHHAHSVIKVWEDIQDPQVQPQSTLTMPTNHVTIIQASIQRLVL